MPHDLNRHLQTILPDKCKSLLHIFFLVCFLSFVVFSQDLTTSTDLEGDRTLIVNEAPEMNVIAFGRSVVIRQQAKEVFVWGGDVTIEGRVEGDVAVIGGSVIQKTDAYIGGAVIIIGGTYKPEADIPLRAEGKETIMFGAFEDEFRSMGEDPAQIFAPQMTVSFALQRLLSVIFWFIVTLAFATIAPGAVSRGITRLRLYPLKIASIGAGALILTTLIVIGSLRVLPDYAGAVIGIMAFVILMLAYGFGRVVMQVSLGKILLKRFSSGGKHSESVAILIGVVCWTLLLSFPYIWPIAVFAMFVGGIGLIATARLGLNRIN